MPNYRRAFVPGGCWFFTVNLPLDWAGDAGREGKFGEAVQGGFAERRSGKGRRRNPLPLPRLQLGARIAENSTTFSALGAENSLCFCGK
jgi:hypothetical protein